MEKFSTGFSQPFHRISTVKKGLKTNRDAVIVCFSTKYRPPIYYYISKRSLTSLNFCLDKGVHFNDEVVVNSSKHEDYEILLEALFQKYITNTHNLLEITPKHTYRLVTPLVGFKSQMERKMERYPFHKNVFLMMKFRGQKNRRVYQYIKKTLAAHNLNCVRADEDFWDITRNAYNPVAVLYCCKYGIALFDEPEPGNEYSPNVAYELGIMHNQGKECLILKSADIDRVPFDLVKELYVNYDENLELEGIIESWVTKIKNQ